MFSLFDYIFVFNHLTDVDRVFCARHRLGAKMNLTLFSHLVFGDGRNPHLQLPMFYVSYKTASNLQALRSLTLYETLGAKSLDFFLFPVLLSVPGTFSLLRYTQLSVL